MSSNQIIWKKVCVSCNEMMILSEGDILFDGKWCHKDCWHNNEDITR